MPSSTHLDTRTAKYPYKSLSLSHREIRLLELKPARSIDDPVVCRLVHVRLANDPEFIGLSALYGDHNVTESVYVDGLKLRLPVNIAQALRNVRAVFLPESARNADLEQVRSQEQVVPTAPTRPAKRPPRWLRHLMKGVNSILPDPKRRRPQQTPLRVWLDVLCVDERNSSEDEQRRSHMAMAYHSAKMVVGWLGPKDDTSDLAVEIIRAWDKCMPRTFGEEGDRIVHPDHYAPHMVWMAPVAHLSEVPPDIKDPADVPSYKAISSFLNRPYFQRSWILDEISFAKFPAFLVGDEIVSWMQVLRLNLVNEEIKNHGAGMFPDELRYLLDYMPLGTVYTFLREFEGRQKRGGVPLYTPSTTSSATSFDSGSSRPPGSRQ